jgi:hypothetical protein
MQTITTQPSKVTIMLRDTLSTNQQERQSDASMTGQKNYALAWKHAERLCPDSQSTARVAGILHHIVNALSPEQGRAHKISYPRET